MKSELRVCVNWTDVHDRPVYTMGQTCPDCGGSAVNSAPASFDPADPYGPYRRALKRGLPG
ncbi:MAG: RNA-protein complex protein Nop10 [Halobacteriales archaeon]|nr:RNA-protein complex protein Nop10 [Halobacteriales archaeon]